MHAGVDIAANQREKLERVFGIEIESCAGCGGKLRIIAKILSHLQRTALQQCQPELTLGARAPSVQASFL